MKGQIKNIVFFIIINVDVDKSNRTYFILSDFKIVVFLNILFLITFK